MSISVIIPTFNPNARRLQLVLNGLRGQTLDHNKWEVIIVDNNSSPPVREKWCREHLGRDLVVEREPNPGLSHARLAGVRRARHPFVAFSDDDNVFSSDYLEESIRLLAGNPEVGVAGGKSIPCYEAPVPAWYEEGIAPLGCRDLGEQDLVFRSSEFAREERYPDCAPIGAGMIFRKEVMEQWMQLVGKTGISDRKGNNLSSAGDCDMVLYALEAGYDAAYWPTLSLQHHISADRVTPRYLAAVSRSAYRDFVRVLDIHGIRPWPAIASASVPFRAAKSWWNLRAWRGHEQWIRWQGVLGQYEGRSQLNPES